MPHIDRLIAVGRSLVNQRLLQHLLFWSLSFYVLLRYFAYEEKLAAVDWIYTFLFHISLVAVFYLNVQVLIPRLLRKQYYLGYALGWLGLVLGGTWLNQATFNYLSDYLFPGYFFISYYEFRDIIKFMLIYASVSTLLKLSRSWFALNAQERRLNRLEQEKNRAELQALRAQLDPHFLFNNLNNLYSLSLDADARVPEVILRLSDGMRYMLYDCRDEWVLLDQELDYIRGYIDLYRLGAGARADIRLSVDGSTEGIQVAPLLFLPLVENSFKFGLRSRRKPPWVHLRFHIDVGTITFEARNSISRQEEPLPGRSEQGGIGLANLERRLGLLYPGKHQFTTEKNDEQFVARLILNVS